MKIILWSHGTFFRKIFLSKQFIISCIGCVGALFVSVMEKLPEIMMTAKGDLFPPGTIDSLTRTAVSSEAFYFVLPILSAFPRASSFLHELESGFSRTVLPRYGKNGRCRYIIAQMSSCLLAGGMVPAIGFLVFRAILHLGFHSDGSEIGFWTLIQTNLNTYLLLFFFGAFCSEFGMTISVFFRQEYIALLSPFIICFLPVILRERYFPNMIATDPRTWLSPETEEWICGEYGPALLMVLIITAVGCLFYFCSRKRLSRL